ncbi:MAG: ATP-dependent RecD-like DNA helicase [Clostridia bacterium]|nr:ATP-dependent RecD-like DNA helicase [Clostridia bacterium]MBQ8861773.1 ATP-dependent RecD-like DNA helicase [Clostridia bacterium]
MPNEKNELVSIEGTVEKIIYHNEENGYVVCEMLAFSDELYTVCGNMPYLAVGETIKALGDFVTHPQFGRQFRVEYYEKQLPSNATSILKYLASGTIRGIGPVTARHIVEKYGDDTFEVLENHPEWLADINGISARKAKDIGEAFKAQFGMRNVMAFCRQFFGPATAVRIYKKWGCAAVDVINKNPYILCDEIHGVTFEKADAIAKTLGFTSGSDERIGAGIKFVLQHNLYQNGHVFLPQEKLVETATKLLGCEKEKAEDVLAYLVSLGELKFVRESGLKCIYLPDVYDAEAYIAKKLDIMEQVSHTLDTENLSELVKKVELENGIEYEELQKRAIKEAVANSVFVLTGGPGTGKTTVVRAIIRIFSSMGLDIALAAPTGRAAKRLSEASSMEAKTIHRLLEMQFAPDEQSVFVRDEANPLDEDVVIIDESSMIDVFLMSALLRALKPTSRLVLIGDADQLPPVGPGYVFRDIIESDRFSTVVLTHIFRQARESLIVTNAHAVNNGTYMDLSKKDADFFFLPRPSDEETAATIVSLCAKRLPKTYGLTAFGGIQIITPSKKGVNGTEMLNNSLQAALNPPSAEKREKKVRDIILREGDKVMQIKNDYDIEWARDDGSYGVGVFNGDIGIVEEINLSAERVTVLFDDRRAAYDFSMLDELELAYAITVHKSQGSEYPIVVIPLYRYSQRLLTRNLLYTALTRAQKMVVLVGDEEVSRRMIENNRRTKRYTGLSFIFAKYE